MRPGRIESSGALVLHEAETTATTVAVYLAPSI